MLDLSHKYATWEAFYTRPYTFRRVAVKRIIVKIGKKYGGAISCSLSYEDYPESEIM